jgi:hypothetical protein
MSGRDAKATVARVWVVAAALLAGVSLALPVDAQFSQKPPLGACCSGPGPAGCRVGGRDRCSKLSEQATWHAAVTCNEISCGACADEDTESCRYTTSEACTASTELFCGDQDCSECLENFEPPPDNNSECMMHRVFRCDDTILGNMAVFHQFQDRIVVESAKGREMKALFHEHMHELGLVLLRHPDLLLRGRELLLVAAPGFRDLLDQPGGEPLVLTPDLVQTVNEFLGDVAEHASPEGQAALDRVMAEFDAVAGMSLREIRIAVNAAEGG